MTSKPQRSEEFFYLNDKGARQDADLHGPILARGDIARGLRPPLVIDEKIMKPIRDKNRAAAAAAKRV